MKVLTEKELLHAWSIADGRNIGIDKMMGTFSITEFDKTFQGYQIMIFKHLFKGLQEILFAAALMLFFAIRSNARLVIKIGEASRTDVPGVSGVSGAGG